MPVPLMLGAGAVVFAETFGAALWNGFLLPDINCTGMVALRWPWLVRRPVEDCAGGASVVGGDCVTTSSLIF